MLRSRQRNKAPFLSGGAAPLITGASYVEEVFDSNAQGANLTGISVNGGNFYVASGNLGNILKYNSSGTYVEQWSSGASPTGIDNYNNVLYVVKKGTNTVKGFDLSGTATGFEFSISGQVTDASGVTFDGSNFYVLDRTAKRVFKYNSSGVYQTGEDFYVSAQATTPAGIKAVNGFLWVGDYGTDEVYKYALDGTYQSVSFDTSAQTNFNNGLAFDGTYFYIVGNDNRGVFKYQATYE